MANTINDLYLKYVNKVGGTLEKDRYFQYLFEMVRAGSNTLQQKRQVLHKVVDERWLSTIEDSLDSISKVIENPRRFVATTEQVVPVALAKKITADSVRHLSQNTQFIASNEDGNVQPTRILNVTTEDSYDLYENRFIYHLIQRLVVFIDKRTDVIFWSTGDEHRNVLSYESSVDDAYEEIHYKLELEVKNHQSFAENDSENMDVFMRIDRVRRLVMALRTSAFCSLMAGCAKVRSPIQRTNLLMKDPDYRKCYQLWQFLERYDEVGYSIEEQDAAIECDEEYLIQLYTNLIANYTVFKTLLEADNRKIDELPNKRKRVTKPKFIKKIQEEFVDTPDIEDVEIRRVFVEEVTQAQLDAEARAEEAVKRMEEAERMAEEARYLMEEAQRQADEAQEAARAAQMAAMEADQARFAAEDAAQEAKERADRRIQRAQNEAQAQVQEAEAAKEEALRQAESAEQAKAIADQARAEAEESARNAEAEKNAALSQAEQDRSERDAAVLERNQAVTAMEEAQKLQQQAEETAKTETEARKVSDQIAEDEKKARAVAESMIARAEKNQDNAIRERDEALSQSKKDRQARLEAERERKKAELSEEAAQKQASSAVAARRAAEEKAEVAIQAQKDAQAEAEELRKAAELAKRRRTIFGSRK